MHAQSQGSMPPCASCRAFVIPWHFRSPGQESFARVRYGVAHTYVYQTAECGQYCGNVGEEPEPTFLWLAFLTRRLIAQRPGSALGKPVTSLPEGGLWRGSLAFPSEGKRVLFGWTKNHWKVRWTGERKAMIRPCLLVALHPTRNLQLSWTPPPPHLAPSCE